MRISKLHIENFRSINAIDLELDETTVFIGANNSGKSAIIEAVRIALSRRWGQRGTGFTENDVHLVDENTDPRTAPPVKISFEFIEPVVNSWPADMVADLEEIMIINEVGLNKVAFSITYTWNIDKETFEPAWEFLNQNGVPLPPKRRSINLSGFYDYILFLWLGALRDVDSEFNSRSRNWGGLLKSVKVPQDLEASIKETLDLLDAQLLEVDPKLTDIAKTIGLATEIAMEDTPGAAKLRMLPLDVWDMLSRAGVILRNEEIRPWLPLGHHGQGLQSLSVMFLFQAAAAQQLAEELHEGTEPIFAIEEPEAHLHPQAARTLWSRISALPGQKLVTTHSPYFVQNVPLHNLRIVRFKNGETRVSAIPRLIPSRLPWTEKVNNLVAGRGIKEFVKNQTTETIDILCHFNKALSDDLAACWSTEADADAVKGEIETLRRIGRVLISKDDENDLSFLGRRIRGEIFFARRWILVEGISEYLLLNALGQVLGYDLDQHGIAIIDFQNNGNAGIYAALAESFEIPWHMITDGDAESEQFKKQLLNRGFNDQDLADHFSTLTLPNSLEDQLLADGHEMLLREILRDIGVNQAMTCTIEEFSKKLKGKKTAYMSRLAHIIAKDTGLAAQMPVQFVSLIEDLKAKRI
ncbi:ATP-dependent nuclease [Pedobacter ginsengisoli]|uniref:ATP-dependent nuclease n=1 Tax=Pedobacter ginsengisoli TaxID=363852 RepID=UPI00254FDF3F|nr:AAA family ATPase [Pedobacter ginsengisoli]